MITCLPCRKWIGGISKVDLERAFRRIVTVIQVRNNGNIAARGVTVEMERSRRITEIFRGCNSWDLIMYDLLE